jgi:hypothetical protein
MEKHEPDDSVAIYIREVVSDIEPLTKDEESKLFLELGARQLSLVVSIAQEH